MHTIRTAALTGTILAALIGTPAFAQTTPTPASGTQGSEPAETAPAGADVATRVDQQNDVIVTGTRVEGRTRLDSISPVDVLSGASLQRQGTTELGAALATVAPSIDFPRPSANDGTDSVRPASTHSTPPGRPLSSITGE